MSTTFMYGAHVHANGIRQHYLRFGGAGPVLVIVPGITSPAATWAFVGEALGQRFDTYVLDVRGRGLSESGRHLDHGTDVYAQDVASFAEALGFDTYHLLGHSLGARTAARLAAHDAGHVSKLILADPPVSGPGRRPYVKTLAFYLDPIRAALKGGMDHEAMAKSYPTWSDAQVRMRGQWLHTCDEKAITMSHQSFQDDDFHADLPSISAATLLLVAGQGGVILEDDVTELQTLKPDLNVARMPLSGHMLPFDDLDSFLVHIHAFLS